LKKYFRYPNFVQKSGLSLKKAFEKIYQNSDSCPKMFDENLDFCQKNGLLSNFPEIWQPER